MLRTEQNSGAMRSQQQQRKREDAESGAPKSKKKKKTCSRVIALSALDPVDRDIIESVVNTLGDAEVVHEMTGDVTHVVVGEMKRTFKVLSALAQGMAVVWCILLEHLCCCSCGSDTCQVSGL